jgi:hypothetical protein
MSEPVKRSCRMCRCTDDNCDACVAKLGQPCRWVAADLCSACTFDAHAAAHGTKSDGTPLTPFERCAQVALFAGSLMGDIADQTAPAAIVPPGQVGAVLGLANEIFANLALDQLPPHELQRWAALAAAFAGNTAIVAADCMSRLAVAAAARDASPIVAPDGTPAALATTSGPVLVDASGRPLTSGVQHG